MKKQNLPLSFIMMLFLALGCGLNSCAPDEESENIAPFKKAQNMGYTPDPCYTCESETLYKTVGNDNEPVGTVTICQTRTDITLTYTLADSRNRAWFQQTGYRIYTEAPLAINPGSLTEKESHNNNKPRQISYTIPLASLGQYGDPGDILYIATWAVVPGPDGAGGMIWAGALSAPTQNPNSRYFTYTIKKCHNPKPPKKY